MAGLVTRDHCIEQGDGARRERHLHPDAAQSDASAGKTIGRGAGKSAAEQLHHTARIWAKQIREQRYVAQLTPEVLSYMLRKTMVTEQQMLQAGLCLP